MTDKPKIALITGGTRGIGAQMSRAIKNSGYHVIANCKTRSKHSESFCTKHDLQIAAFDVSDFATVQSHIGKLIEEHGKIDVLVNNAGITRDTFLHKMDRETWDAVIDTNLSSSFNTCRAVIPAMREKGYGRVVNISSINAQKGQMGQANYAAAKAGLLGFTKSLALENAIKGITVNAIAPGYIDTPMTQQIPDAIRDSIVAEIPVGRIGQPDDIVKALLYLISEDSGYVTGSVLSVNGGHYMAS